MTTDDYKVHHKLQMLPVITMFLLHLISLPVDQHLITQCEHTLLRKLLHTQ